MGASAGALDALNLLVSQAYEECGLTMIVSQHQPRFTETGLEDLLRRTSRLPVSVVNRRLLLQRNYIYLAPAGGSILLKEGAIYPSEDGFMPHMFTVDRLFSTLADALREYSIGIVLSGAGTDGTRGSIAIKDAMGTVIAQDPHTAAHKSMPKSVISNGLADAILPPEKIVSFLCRPKLQPRLLDEYSLQWILLLIRNSGAPDFSIYKKSILSQLVNRRMAFNQVSEVDDYIKLLKESSAEISALAQNLRCKRSLFFRPLPVFESLKSYLLEILQGRAAGSSFRAWLPGCSTGEQAYSVAILIEETLVGLGQKAEVRIMATDSDQDALRRARQGTYLENIAYDVNEDRLKKYFTSRVSRCTINEDVRRKILFSVHDLLADEPIHHTDLILAPNWFSYLNSDMQEKALSIFHYSLKEGGLLVMETGARIAGGERFEMMDPSHNIYRCRNKPAKSWQLPIVMPPPIPAPDPGVNLHRPMAEGFGYSSNDC